MSAGSSEKLPSRRRPRAGAECLQSIITQLLSGFSVVAILVIAALGLAIIFGVAGVINMAHGEMIMVGAYTAAVVGKLGGNTLLESTMPMEFRSLAPSMTTCSRSIVGARAHVVAVRGC
jgi:branched-subunit amino acid ABC-type transport system permease component